MKKKSSQIPTGVISPFASDAFLASWQAWKDYRQEQHNFKYKGVMSEQAALMWIADESGNDEETAIQIIKHSMANGWKGFFKLKNNINGQPTAKTRAEHIAKVQTTLERRIAARQQG
jgi:hypothetical protein